MPKKMLDDAPSIAHLAHGESTPPQLSEKLIAQLQGAVEAAQRKRKAPPRFVTDTQEESSSNQ
jgi:hypothetical protein